MKCIHCQQDAKYKDRQDGYCPRCRKKFVFEPKNKDQFTDAAFAAAIARVSSQGAVAWTPHHLYYELNRHLVAEARKAQIIGYVIFLLIFTGATFYALTKDAYLIGVVGGVLVFFLGKRLIFRLLKAKQRCVFLSFEDFKRMWNRWVAVNRAPPGVMLPAVEPVVPRALPTDISSYSFDRAVICDRPETVDVLIANRFHFENNCALLAITGHPRSIFDTVRAMLRRNPKLRVYVVHDATPAGCALGRRLAMDRAWFAGTGARVIEVGLRPGQTEPFRGAWQMAAAIPDPSPSLSPAEYEWLSMYQLELAVIRPEQLIKRLFRAITADEQRTGDKNHNENDEDESLLWIDNTSFSSDASSADGGADSFG